MILEDGTSTIVETSGTPSRCFGAMDKASGARVHVSADLDNKIVTLTTKDGYAFTFPAELIGSFRDLLNRVL